MSQGSTPLNFSLKIDRQIFLIDFSRLNLLQAVLFAKASNEQLRAIKLKFGINNLTAGELQQELSSINSPLRKYLMSMMLSMVDRAEFLLSETMHNFLLSLDLKNKIKTRRLLMLLQKRRYRWRSWINFLNRRLRVVGAILSQNVSRLSPASMHYLQSYILEAHRYDLLNFYLQHADAKLLSITEQAINSHINILNYSMQKYWKIAEKETLDSIQLYYLQEWLEFIMSRIELIDTKKTIELLKRLTQLDAGFLKQYLVTLLSGDLIAFRQLERMDPKKITYVKKQSSDDLSSSIRHVEDLQYKLDRVMKSPTFKGELFIKKLNSYFIDIVVVKKGIIIHEARALLALINDLVKLNSKCYFSHDTDKVKKHALVLMERLHQVEDADYSTLIELLKEHVQEPINLEILRKAYSLQDADTTSSQSFGHVNSKLRTMN